MGSTNLANASGGEDNDKVVYYYAQPRCVLKCGFCYARWDQPNESLNAAQLTDLILTAKKNGFNHFGFTGSNALKRSDIGEVLHALKENDMITRIDTHWIGNTLELTEQYAEYIDLLWLPVDWHIASIHDFNRDAPGHFKTVTDLIRNIKAKALKVKLKIHTVLTSRNYASVMMMKDLVQELSPDIWSIYRFFPGWDGYKKRGEFEINDELFEMALKALPTELDDVVVDIPGREINDKSFLMITSNGEVYGCFDATRESYMSFGKYNEWWFENALRHYGNEWLNSLTKREFHGDTAWNRVDYAKPE